MARAARVVPLSAEAFDGPSCRFSFYSKPETLVHTSDVGLQRIGRETSRTQRILRVKLDLNSRKIQVLEKKRKKSKWCNFILS